MSKNNGFGKFVLFCAAVGAAAAGAYYYLSKRDERIAEGFDEDDFDDFDDFEDDDFEASQEVKFGSRKYVDIKTGDDSAPQETATKEPATEKEAEPDKSEEFFDDEK